MSWRQPTNLFGSSVSDRAMMEEVLELLATDSPSNEESTTSTTTSTRSNIDENNHCSNLTRFNCSSLSAKSTDQEIIDNLDITNAIETPEKGTSRSNNDCDDDEEKYPIPGLTTDQETSQEQKQEAEAAQGIGQPPPMPPPMYAPGPTLWYLRANLVAFGDKAADYTVWITRTNVCMLSHFAFSGGV
ncbi:unnamed protein product [Phytophthora fragariaefolia]|uniref:Unnamed protein product n=1 Tax=Phytophthora fragariaefolia TaxID=1490495 RepID=A0A9W6UCD9_9STRA|nr:unnamed protein product [Phytophthora fragariaefolia]